MSLDDSCYHVAGDILATTAFAIGKALATLPETTIDRTS